MELAQFQTFRVAASDLNGQMRGKRVPGSYGTKLEGGVVRMPLSVLNVDLWGADIADSPLVFESGDADGILLPTERGAVPMPWLERPSAFVPMAMYLEDGQTPFGGDPRHALARVLGRYAARDWRVIAATEMEFTLVDDQSDTLRAPRHPRTGRWISGPGILSMPLLDAFDDYFSALYEACEAMGIPAQTAMSESGVGQFEVTLMHQDAMRAADDAWLFKVLARGLARQQGFAATFMAKPYEDDAGNGMHLHFSVVDAAGANIFDNGGPDGSDMLRHAVAGCVAHMPAASAIFAPHMNSYSRLVPGAHAPTGAAWAYENRTAALRIPAGDPEARRIEHRVAGGDINPYLVLAAVLGSAMQGIEAQAAPPDPISGNAYERRDLAQLAADLPTALGLLENDMAMAEIFDPLLIDCFCRTKRQEMRHFAKLDPNRHWTTYLERV
ncbi:MAG: glutamine synthetase family protein [Rhodobacteraceae bacterium]|nr:glutamine synthetase family protein [Paracoccaceae bacterium]